MIFSCLLADTVIIMYHASRTDNCYRNSEGELVIFTFMAKEHLIKHVEFEQGLKEKMARHYPK